MLLLLIACGPSPIKIGGDDSGTGLVTVDRDGDGITDVDEGEADVDGDSLANADDLDSDADAIPDATEAGDEDLDTPPIDSDRDTTPDFLDEDSDNNCIPDADETRGGDIDGDGVTNHADPDDDGDGFSDVEEGSCDGAPDSDGDGHADSGDADADGDGIDDELEGSQDSDGDGTPDRLDTDSDGDGWSDEVEGTVDTDSDGTADYLDLDSDGDALSDSDEHHEGTGRTDRDSDDDGWTDGVEVVARTNPLDADLGFTGIYGEVASEAAARATGTVIAEVQRTDVGVVLDTTCSMGSAIHYVREGFREVVDALLVDVSSPAWAVSTFDDYAYGSYGSSGTDWPFILQQQLTTDEALIEEILGRIQVHSGGDGPESGMEALYQAATGAGYDMDCDGNLDTVGDVRPFVADSGDAFGGSIDGSWDSGVVGTGADGGLGLRTGALPVFVFVTDNYLRDPESADSTINGSPGGCSLDAGRNDVIAAMLEIEGRVAGVSVNGSLAMDQLRDLADATDSWMDSDGDGDVDTESVDEWDDSTDLAPFIVAQLVDLVTLAQFDTITASVEGDTHGFVTAISPDAWDDTSVNTALSITLALSGVVDPSPDDQVFTFDVYLLGDGVVDLGGETVIVVVPGG